MISEAERVLLIINRVSGNGNAPSLANRLYSIAKDSIKTKASLDLKIVDDHPSARDCARAFFKQSERPAAIIAGGGSGTVRAVIEGVCEKNCQTALPDSERIRIASLRMGSGNLIARKLGVPKDPEAAMRGIAANLLKGNIAECSVMRCETGNAAGGSEIHYAAVMAGLGEFGRVPGKLAKWHKRFPLLRKALSKLLGIERLNRAEYLFALLARFSRYAIFADSPEAVSVRAGNQTRSMRLLAGAVVNFPFDELPFDMGMDVEDEAASVYLVPLQRPFQLLLALLAPNLLEKYAWNIEIEMPEQIEIKFPHRDKVEFFLDEDPVEAYGQISIGIAGKIAFVPFFTAENTERRH